MKSHYTAAIYAFENFCNKMLEKISFYDKKNDEEIKPYKMLLKTGTAVGHYIIA